MLSFLIFLFIIIFIVWPLIKFWLRVRSVRASYARAFDEMQREARRRQRDTRPGGWHNPEGEPSHKKYGPDEGEYVEWEELSVTETETHTRTDAGRDVGTASQEKRIVDVEWEDIKYTEKK